MKNEISELAASKIIAVSASTMINWRRNGTIPADVYKEKKYAGSTVRYRYFRDKFEDWARTHNLIGDESNGI